MVFLKLYKLYIYIYITKLYKLYKHCFKTESDSIAFQICFKNNLIGATKSRQEEKSY